MKFLLLPVCLFLLTAASFAQTPSPKILDSTVGWDSAGVQTNATLVIFLSGTDSVNNASIGSLQVTLGSAPDSTNILNSTYIVGTNLSVVDNTFSVPLGIFDPGDYYVGIKVNLLDGSIDHMEYKSSN